MTRTCGNCDAISRSEPSVDALSATMTSQPSGIDATSPGRNLRRNPSVFQFNMTTAAFCIFVYLVGCRQAAA